MNDRLDPLTILTALDAVQLQITALRTVVVSQLGAYAEGDPAEDDDLVPYYEAADVLDRSVEAVRQLARRYSWRVYRNGKPLVSMTLVRQWLTARG